MSPSKTPVHAAHLLRSAVALHATDVPAVALDDAYDDLHQALGAMHDVLLRDAHATLRTPLADRPDDPYLCCLDLDGERPGIVHATKPRLTAVHVERDDVDAADDPAHWLADDAIDAFAPESTPPRIERPSLDAAMRAAVAEETRQLKTLTKRAASHERRDEATLEKREERARQKRARAEETPEQRAERLAKAREERAEKKRQKEEEKQAAAAAAAAAPAPQHPPPDAEEAAEAAEGEPAAATATGDDGSASAPQSEVTACAVDTAAVRPADAVLPTPLRVADGEEGKKKTKRFYANPTPCVRALRALARVRPGSAALAEALLRGVPTDALEIVQGPPGTGKSEAIVQRVRALPPTARVLLAAPSNVSAAGLYERLLTVCPELRAAAALCLPPARIPVGTVVLSNDPTRRIVCATVSGRAGPTLDGQAFDVVFLDEAAQCSEACTWTLVRPEVQRLVLVGDTAQLPAVVVDDEAQRAAHGRSLMERLACNLHYPVTRLDVQHRMRPAISAFPNAHFYEGALVDADACRARPPLRTDAPAAYVAHRVRGGREESLGTSWRNAAEARAVARCAQALRARLPKERTIAIVAPYKAQCRAILACDPGVPVHTIDSFQGRQADAVLLSVCRTGERAGFWSEARRLNVALTRARDEMHVFGAWDWTQAPLDALRADLEARLAAGDADVASVVDEEA